MTFRRWQLLVMILLFAVVSAAASMAYANRVAHDSERRWCGLIVTLDDTYRETPPQTPTGRRLAADIRQLRADFGCP